MLVHHGMAKTTIEQIVNDNKKDLKKAIEEHIGECQQWLKYIEAMKTTDDIRNMDGSWIWSDTDILDTHRIAGKLLHLYASVTALSSKGEDEWK